VREAGETFGSEFRLGEDAAGGVRGESAAPGAGAGAIFTLPAELLFSILPPEEGEGEEEARGTP